MKQIVCPICGSQALRHIEDVFLVWTPILNDNGELGRLDPKTEGFSEYFECRECGHRPCEAELLSSAEDRRVAP